MPAEQLQLNFAATVVPTGRADGAVLVIPGKLVVTEEYLSVAQVATLTGYTPRHIRKLAKKVLGAKQWNKRCKLRIPSSEVSRFLQLRA